MKEADVEKIIHSLIDRAYPKEMRAPELRKLAAGTGLSPESIRQIRRRRSLEAKNLVKLLLAVGVKANDLMAIPNRHGQRATVSNAHNEWNMLGTTLSEDEAREFITFIKCVRKQWHLK